MSECPRCGSRIERFLIDGVPYYACPGCGMHDVEGDA